MFWVIPVPGLVWVSVGVCRSPLGSVVGCACLNGWVSSLGQDEASGTVVEQSQRTTPAVHHPLPVLCGTGSSAGYGSVVLVVGRWEGVVAVDSPVCVTFAVEESSFSRAGEWYHQPGHSTGTGNQDWEPVP